MKYLIALFFSVQAMAYNPYVTIKYDVKFAQTGTNKAVDILFVIDNSGSMHRKQNLLAKLAKDFLVPLNNIDYQIAAISTDQLNIDSPYIITPKETSQYLLADLMIHFGISGSGTELIFYNIAQYLKTNQSKLLFRPHSNREIIMVTDEKEQSVNEYGPAYSAVETLKLFSKNTTFNGLIPKTEVCYHTSPPALNLMKIISDTNGNMINICGEDEIITSDYKELARSIAKRAEIKFQALMPVSKVKLHDQVNIDSISVSFGDQIIPRGLINEGWIYDSFSNEIIFGKNIILSEQPKESQLKIEYKVL